MKYLLLFTALIISGMAPAAMPRHEQGKVIDAAKTVLLYVQLQRLTEQCGMPDYPEAVSKSALGDLIKAKTHVGLEQFAEILSQEMPEFKSELEKARTLVCNMAEPGQVLENVYDAYDMALFRLDLLEPLEHKLMSRAEFEEDLARQREAAFEEVFEQADIIAIGTLIYSKNMLRQFKKHFVNTKDDNKYAYHLESGWRKVASKYALADKLSHEQGQAAEITEQHVGNKYLFFISGSTIEAQIPIEQSDKYLKRLGKEDWYWIGGMVHKN